MGSFRLRWCLSVWTAAVGWLVWCGARFPQLRRNIERFPWDAGVSRCRPRRVASFHCSEALWVQCVLWGSFGVLRSNRGAHRSAAGRAIVRAR